MNFMKDNHSKPKRTSLLSEIKVTTGLDDRKRKTFDNYQRVCQSNKLFFASYFWKEQVVHVPWKLINLIKTSVIDIAIKFRVLNTVATTKPWTHLTNDLVLSTDQVGFDYWNNSWS